MAKRAPVSTDTEVGYGFVFSVFRRRLGVAIDKLAADSQVSEDSLAAAEAGTYTLTYPEADRIARNLGIPLSAITKWADRVNASPAKLNAVQRGLSVAEAVESAIKAIEEQAGDELAMSSGRAACAEQSV